MKKKYKIFEDTPFTIKDKYGIDPKTIDSALTEAIRFVDNQTATAAKTQSSAAMLVTVLSAIMAAAIGILMTHPSAFWHCITLLALSLIPMFILIFGTMFRRTIFYSGDTPSHYITRETLKWVEEMQNGYTALDRSSLLKLLHLEELQFRIIQNNEIQESITLWYRVALLFMAVSYTAAFVALVLLRII